MTHEDPPRLAPGEAQPTPTTNPTTRRAVELATVHPLPTRPDTDDTTVEEGQLLSDAEYERLTSQQGQAVARWQGYRTDVVIAARAARTVVGHHHTRTAVKAVVRNAIYVPAGGLLVAKRVWESKTNSRYERLMNTAEAASDHEKLLEWEQRAEAARDRRHHRRMDLIGSPWVLVKAGALAIAALVVLLLGLGVVLAVADKDAGQILAPITGALTVIRAVSWTLALFWTPPWLIAPWLVVVLVLWHLGRTKAATPAWVAPSPPQPGTDARDIIPDAGAILGALRHLGIPALNQAFRKGWGSPSWPTRLWVQEPHRDGKGWRAQLNLPQGINVATLNAKKPILAHNLARVPTEVWATEPRGQAGVLDLWVANPGALSGAVPPWPLLAELDTVVGDYFAGVPAGVNIRGDMVRARLFEANYVAGGIMGSGKSTLVITLLLGAMLDPLVEIDVFVMAENADYHPMRPRLRTLVTGTGQDTVRACLDTLTDLYAELTERGKALREHDEPAVTRPLAQRDPRLRPRIVVVDECQALFMDDKHGETATDICVKLLSAARKYAITLLFLTPEPTGDSLPRKLISVISNKACFAIGDQTGNDAVLGTGSYKAGVSAVGLEPKTDESDGDVGTAMTRGFSAKPSLLRSYFVPQPDKHRVTARAMALRADARPAIEAADAIARRDVLADVGEVMAGADRVRSAEVLRRLTGRWPDTYQGWSAQRFAAELTQAGVSIRLGRVDGQAGQRYLAADDLFDVLDGRAEPDDEEPDGLDLDED
jgi:S-DNA-T family DNA segregation ATPase FtsK/SpoIIIE